MYVEDKIYTHIHLKMYVLIGLSKRTPGTLLWKILYKKAVLNKYFCKYKQIYSTLYNHVTGCKDMKPIRYKRGDITEQRWLKSSIAKRFNWVMFGLQLEALLW